MLSSKLLCWGILSIDCRWRDSPYCCVCPLKHTGLGHYLVWAGRSMAWSTLRAHADRRPSLCSKALTLAPWRKPEARRRKAIGKKLSCIFTGTRGLMGLLFSPPQSPPRRELQRCPSTWFPCCCGQEAVCTPWHYLWAPRGQDSTAEGGRWQKL